MSAKADQETEIPTELVVCYLTADLCAAPFAGLIVSEPVMPRSRAQMIAAARRLTPIL